MGLAFKRTRCRRLTLRNQPAEQKRAAARLLQALGDLGYEDTACFAVRLALEEALINAFKHGGGGRRDARARVCWRAGRQKVVITIKDEGPGFAPGEVPDPTAPERLEAPTGRGLMLMRAYMSEVNYNDKGNVVTMVYDRTAPPVHG